MKLDTFISHLHFDTEKILPSDWQVNWKDAPLPFKLYEGLPEFPLPEEIPLILQERKTAAAPTLEEISQLLWYVYGITQYAQTVFQAGPAENDAVAVQSYRRFVPSGGALYPSEVYLYLKHTEIPVGIYHYSAAHHRLILLRRGNFDSYLTGCLGNSCDISESFAVLFVSTVFWKNFYKYHNFSYRLQGLDAGAVIGQALMAADRLGFIPKVCFQFLDRPVNHLLGLCEQDENVYAVMPLSTTRLVDGEKSFVTESIFQELPELKHTSYQRSKNVIDFPMIRNLNEASIYKTTDQFVKLHTSSKFSDSMETIMLPFVEPLSSDFAAVCRERHSPDIDFTLKKVSLREISTLLRETAVFEYDNDLDEAEGNAKPRVHLYGCFYNAEGISNGAYFYDRNTHALRKIASGDYREYLQSGLLMDNINMFQVPLCLHLAGDIKHYMKEMGYRGYRIQQMEAGILLQRLLLTSVVLGMGGHPLLGFDAKLSDELYRLETKGKTSLIQIPVGPYRPRPWIRGSL